MPLPFLDSMVGPNGQLLTARNPAYENVNGSMEIFANAAGCALAAGVTSFVAYGGAVFSPAQFARATIAYIAGGAYAGVGIGLGASGSGNGYTYYGDTGTAYLIVWTAGGFSVLATGTGFAPGDDIELQMEGGILTPLLNGAMDIAPFADATYVTGRGGLSGFQAGASDAGVMDFETGDLHPALADAGFFFPGVV